MMKYISALSILFAFAQAADLDKPALTSNLDYLLDGNVANLPNRPTYQGQWEAGLMPADCKSLAEGQSLNPSDFEVYDIFYDDCGDGWSFCRHKDSSIDLATMVDTFGRVPVAMRNWVRHVLIIPGDNWAFNSNGNIAFSGTTGANLDVALHETAHSLDLLGAYGEQLSSSQEWTDAYNADSNVPDEYARSNQVENVAQNTVVSVYDRNVPGGFPGIQPNAGAIGHQYGLLESKAGDALVPGGYCDRHLQNSDTVGMSNSRISSRARRAHAFKGEYNNVVTDFVPFSTEGNCDLH